MPSFLPRTIKDQSVENPYRYALKNIDTGIVIATYDIVPAWGEIYQQATDINAAYLQPIENFLKLVGDDLAALGLEIVAVDSRLSDSESSINAKISASNSRIDAIDNKISTLAPLANPVLINPTANTVAVSSNSTNLATTAAVKTYLDGLMAAFVG